MNKILLLAFILITYACEPAQKDKLLHKTEDISHTHSAAAESKAKIDKTGIELIILGTIQDAGSPQIGCKKKCCAKLWDNPPLDRKVVSLGLIDHDKNKQYIIEASPDYKFQQAILSAKAGQTSDKLADGIFITHAHIGHYTGLMQLGREALGANALPVYLMPKMKTFVESNGPWDQLVKLNNISLKSLQNGTPTILSENLKITPFSVPHRDEYSETVGFKIEGEKQTAIFIPDIDKWEKWDQDIIALIKEVDLAFLDGTFYANGEIPNRDMSEIPHPFISESMELFKNLAPTEQAKVHFIHFNHTNPLLDIQSKEFEEFEQSDFKFAKYLSSFQL